MPKFVCSYAHDIACYADFVVEAKNEKAALRQIRKALREGQFENVDPSPCWENGPTNERVFVQGPATEHAIATTLEELTGRDGGASLDSRGARVPPLRTRGQSNPNPQPERKP